MIQRENLGINTTCKRGQLAKSRRSLKLEQYYQNIIADALTPFFLTNLPRNIFYFKRIEVFPTLALH